MDAPLPLCHSQDLQEGGLAVSFDVRYEGYSCRAFAVREKGRVQAYLNRCTHIAMEMDYQPDRFFDESGKWLMCATHGATYDPTTGACVGGPCQGGLIKVELTEQDEQVFWHPTHKLQAPPTPEFPTSPFE